MAFNYRNDLDRMLKATITYWQRRVSTVVYKEKEISDKNAEKIKPSNDRNCAAVVDTGTFNHKPAVAMNDWNKPSVENVFSANTYTKVSDTTVQKHAEMKLLDYHKLHNGTFPEYIGISKPACLRCAVVLVIAGVKFQSSSGGIWNAGWAYPSFLSSSPETDETRRAFRAFIGDELTNFIANDGQKYNVLEIYDTTLSQSQRDDYKSRLKTVQF